jgi:hypothetical protein
MAESSLAELDVCMFLTANNGKLNKNLLPMVAGKLEMEGNSSGPWTSEAAQVNRDLPPLFLGQPPQIILRREWPDPYTLPSNLTNSEEIRRALPQNLQKMPEIPEQEWEGHLQDICGALQELTGDRWLSNFSVIALLQTGLTGLKHSIVIIPIAICIDMKHGKSAWREPSIKIQKLQGSSIISLDLSMGIPMQR